MHRRQSGAAFLHSPPSEAWSETAESITWISPLRLHGIAVRRQHAGEPMARRLRRTAVLSRREYVDLSTRRRTGTAR
jgi:hypothetical protein